MSLLWGLKQWTSLKQPSQEVAAGDSQTMWQDLHNYVMKSYPRWKKSDRLDIEEMRLLFTMLEQNIWGSITSKLA